MGAPRQHKRAVPWRQRGRAMPQETAMGHRCILAILALLLPACSYTVHNPGTDGGTVPTEMTTPGTGAPPVSSGSDRKASCTVDNYPDGSGRSCSCTTGLGSAGNSTRCSVATIP